MQIFQVDAFTDRPFRGNPAAVCLGADDADPAWMQAVAQEMHLSETAFVGSPHAGRRTLRWFTPVTEVELCGHATLASAHVLWELGEPGSECTFQTRSGLLTARREGRTIWLDLPAWPPSRCTLPPAAAEAIGAPVMWAGRAGPDILVEVGDEEAVVSLAPDLGVLAALDARAVVVTARARPGAGVDVVSRVFAPAVGVPEDPVTGSAHCALGPYWDARIADTDRVRPPALLAAQRSPRGGRLAIHLQGERVLVGGTAVTVLHGRLASQAMDVAAGAPSDLRSWRTMDPGPPAT